MEHKNKYEAWSPLQVTAGRVLVEKLVDENEGLVIHLSFPYDPSYNEKIMVIQFSPYIAYRNMDESYRAKTVSDTGGFADSLYTVKSSSWLNWLHEESLGFYESSEIVHYSIITEADFIDVLSEFAPKVSWK